MLNLARTSPSALAPAQSLRDVLRSCDPDAPLASGDPRWEDFAPARGDQAIEALGRELEWRAEGRFVHAAFVSHRGAGKSTEILRLTERLKGSYETVYLEEGWYDVHPLVAEIPEFERERRGDAG